MRMSNRRSRDFLFGGATGLLVLALVSACGARGKKGSNEASSAAIVKECVLPSEQQFSLQAKWSTAPIRVSFHAGDFDANESKAIFAGGETWNKFFNVTKGFSIFNMGASEGSLNQSTNNQVTPSCSSGTLSDGTVLYKRFSSWSHSTAAIAVTTTCFTTSNTGGLANIFNAIMEFNYVNFYVANSNRFPDMQSIALHELGHLLGLDHSCGGLGRPNQNKANVACPDVNADPNNELISTVMFPQVFFDGSGIGEVKQTLTSNDMGRANCLY